jgi:hypothetical protein
MFPEKRNEVLYVRIRKSCKNFVRKLAEKHEVSESIVVDYLLEQSIHTINKLELGAYVSKKKPSKRSAKAV